MIILYGLITTGIIALLIVGGSKLFKWWIWNTMKEDYFGWKKDTLESVTDPMSHKECVDYMKMIYKSILNDSQIEDLKEDQSISFQISFFKNGRKYIYCIIPGMPGSVSENDYKVMRCSMKYRK